MKLHQNRSINRTSIATRTSYTFRKSWARAKNTGATSEHTRNESKRNECFEMIRSSRSKPYSTRLRRPHSLLGEDVTIGWWLWEMLIMPRIDSHSRTMKESRRWLEVRVLLALAPSSWKSREVKPIQAYIP